MENISQLFFQQNWESLILPSLGVKKEKLAENYSKYTIEPLHKGFGVTVGHALRRTLLSSILGCAVYAVKIEGISHEYETIKGIQEDVLQILFNVKELQLKQEVEADVELELIAEGPKVVTAGDISTFGKIEVVNPDQVICTLGEGARLDMTLYARIGHGFVASEENQTTELPVGSLFLDTNYSPVASAHYEITNTRVGQRTDFDCLTFYLKTTGSIETDHAMAYAAKILKEHFNPFITFDEEIIVKEEVVEEPTFENKNLLKNINELELSVRSINCLQNAKIETVADLIQKTEAEMLKTKNFGRKSLQEIKNVLFSMGLSLNIDIETMTTKNN